MKYYLKFHNKIRLAWLASQPDGPAHVGRGSTRHTAISTPPLPRTLDTTMKPRMCRDLEFAPLCYDSLHRVCLGARQLDIGCDCQKKGAG
jgi:hypothetical protein